MNQVNLIAHFTDSSSTSRYAFELAKLFIPFNKGLQITPIHIWGDWQPYTHNVLFPFAPLGGDIAEFEREIEEAAKGAIRDWLEIEGEEPYMREPIIYHGSCHADLPKVFSHNPFDMVVVGAHGAGGTVPNSVGSVTQRVVQSATIPALVARGTAAQKPQLAKLLLVIDLTQRSHYLLAEAVQLAMMLQADLELLYVFPDPIAHQQNDILGSAINFNPDYAIALSKEKINSYFDGLVRKLNVGFKHLDYAQYVIQNAQVIIGDPADTIIDYALEEQHDLIILASKDPGNRDRTARMGRVARQLLFDAPCDLYFAGSFKETARQA